MLGLVLCDVFLNCKMHRFFSDNRAPCFWQLRLQRVSVMMLRMRLHRKREENGKLTVRSVSLNWHADCVVIRQRVGRWCEIIQHLRPLGCYHHRRPWRTHTRHVQPCRHTEPLLHWCAKNHILPLTCVKLRNYVYKPSSPSSKAGLLWLK